MKRIPHTPNANPSSPSFHQTKDQRGRLRRQILEAVQQAIRAADPSAIIRRRVRLQDGKLVAGSTKLDLSFFDRVFVIGGGKASLGMALEIERILGDTITDGLVNIPDYLTPRPRNHPVKLNPATHPIPSIRGVLGVEKMLKLAGKPTPRDLVICLISGGGSALMPLPVPGVSLRDKQQVTMQLLKSGANINEVNTVRKHLSGVKGGRLAERLYPATVLSLIISDVVGDRMETIASGPTAPDTTTYAEARRVLQKYRVWNNIPRGARVTIEKGLAGLLMETPKPNSRFFERVHNIIVGSNRQPCAAAAQTLQRRGYKTIVLTTQIGGEARHVGRFFSDILADLNSTEFSLGSPVALVAGGETTVTVKGKGKGGRNQELVLAAALGIHGLSAVAIASFGTDGLDGPTDAAGAFADGSTVRRAFKRRMDPQDFLENNDSYHFFKKLKDLIITGPTGTTVNDIVIAVSRHPALGTSVGRAPKVRLLSLSTPGD